MGQALGCRVTQEDEVFATAQRGDVETLEALFKEEPPLIHRTTVYDRLSLLHIAAANGQIQVLFLLLELSVNPDVLNRQRQTPLMLAAMHGKISCVQKLLQAGANILMFDSLHGRTCLHYAAYYGHSDCLQAILSAANSTAVADSWGFVRFVNIRDANGATPLHLAARQQRPNCVHTLLDSGALVCAATGRYGCPGSTPLHLAARGGCLDSIRELLSWGADRLQRDSSGRIPYAVALKYKHGTCAALLNPSAAAPLVWPSPLKFISELNPEVKVLLERALMESNREREKTLLEGTVSSSTSPVHSESDWGDDVDEASDIEICCICFDQACTIEVQNCGHQMCAHCTLALCCHHKPDPTTTYMSTPVCPFCRSEIARLVVARVKDNIKDKDSPLKRRKSNRSKNLSEGSSSFKGLSAIGSFRKISGRGSGRTSDSVDWLDKL